MEADVQWDGDGLGALTRVARAISKDASKDWRREVRAAGRPMVNDAKSRFRRLDGALSTSTARSVSLAISNTGVEMKLGGPKYPAARAREFGSNRGVTRKHDVSDAFGRGVRLVGITKRINYRSPRIFGSWTGNDNRSGRAFYPAYREGRADTLSRLYRLRNDYANRLLRAAE